MKMFYDTIFLNLALFFDNININLCASDEMWKSCEREIQIQYASIQMKYNSRTYTYNFRF